MSARSTSWVDLLSTSQIQSGASAKYAVSGSAGIGRVDTIVEAGETSGTLIQAREGGDGAVDFLGRDHDGRHEARMFVSRAAAVKGRPPGAAGAGCAQSGARSR